MRRGVCGFFFSFYDGSYICLGFVCGDGGVVSVIEVRFCVRVFSVLFFRAVILFICVFGFFRYIRGRLFGGFFGGGVTGGRLV